MEQERRNLPEWLSQIPMPDTPKRTSIEVIEGFEFPLDLLWSARAAEVGSIVGTMSIASEALRQQLVELTEMPGWRDLPTEPTSITRTSRGSWTLKVGEREHILNAQEFDVLLADHIDMRSDTD